MARGWTPEEDALIAEYYPTKGALWIGWRKLLPGRTVNAIRVRANHYLGVRNRRSRLAEQETGSGPERVSAGHPDDSGCRTCGRCMRFRPSGRSGTGFGRCVSRHANDGFLRAAMVLATTDATECPDYARKPAGKR